MKHSRYAELTALGQLKIREEDVRCGDDEVIVRVEACGLCQYDAAYFKGLVGNPPQRLGHEPVGVIEEVGTNVTGFVSGERVTGLYGFLKSFAEYVTAKPEELLRVPDGIPAEEALGEPVKCISTIVRAANPQFGDNVLVMGTGFMGLLTVAGLTSAGLNTLIAVDLDPTRLEKARSFGATHTVRGDDPDLLDRVRTITGGRGVDVAVELTSNPVPVEMAAKTLRSGGRPRYVLAGWHGAPGEYVLRNWTTVGAEIICAHPRYSLDPMDDVRRGVEGIVRGVLPMRETITHRYSLDRIQEGFETMISARDGYIKGVVVL